MNLNLIAPCGMNCSLCIGYVREKNKCPGCRKTDAYELSCGKKCIIRSCQTIKKNGWKYCSDKCENFPCKRLKNLDKRYKTKYCMSMIDNLMDIQELGVRTFIKNEEKKWKCNNCGETLCVHRVNCLNCGEKHEYYRNY